MQKYKVKISGKIYHQAFEESWLDSLSVFAYMVKEHPGKNYYYKTNQKTKFLKELAAKLGFSQTMFFKHFKILVDKGLVSITQNTIKLTTNKEFSRQSRKCVYIPNNVNSYKEIKLLLKSIPFISLLKSQQKKIDRIKRYLSISQRAETTTHNISAREYKALLRYKKRGGKMNVNTQLMASLCKIMDLLEVESKTTVTKIKKFLKEKGIIDYFNEKRRIFGGKVSFSEFLQLKSNEYIERYCFYNKGYIYQCMPTIFSVS